MTDWTPSPGVKPGTWGAFIDYASRFGVTVETMPHVDMQDGTKGSRDYLERTGGPDVLSVAIGMRYDPSRRLGPERVKHFCERLSIPVPPNWPSILPPKPDAPKG